MKQRREVVKKAKTIQEVKNMLKITDDFDVLIEGNSNELLVQYGTLTANMYKNFIENDVDEPAKVMLLLTNALVAGIGAAQKGGETNGD